MKTNRLSRMLNIAMMLISVLMVSCGVDKSADIQGKGIWVVLKDGQKCDGYYLRNNHVYGLWLDSIAGYRYFESMMGVDINTFAAIALGFLIRQTLQSLHPQCPDKEKTDRYDK